MKNIHPDFNKIQKTVKIIYSPEINWDLSTGFEIEFVQLCENMDNPRKSIIRTGKIIYSSIEQVLTKEIFNLVDLMREKRDLEHNVNIAFPNPINPIFSIKIEAGFKPEQIKKEEVEIEINKLIQNYKKDAESNKSKACFLATDSYWDSSILYLIYRIIDQRIIQFIKNQEILNPPKNYHKIGKKLSDEQMKNQLIEKYFKEAEIDKDFNKLYKALAKNQLINECLERFFKFVKKHF